MTTKASTLFALSQSRRCEGREECHWCGGACDRRWIHDDVPSLPLRRSYSTAFRPGNPFVCVGCWYYRRPSVTVRFLSGEIKDRQSLQNHSWLLTQEEVRAVGKADGQALYHALLHPPLVFSLSLLNEEKTKNLLQLAVVNEHPEVLANTVLKYTLNNREYEYTVYELEEALRNGLEGKSGGVRALVDLLGDCDAVPRKLEEWEDAKRGRGRPKKEEERPPTKKVA